MKKWKCHCGRWNKIQEICCCWKEDKVEKLALQIKYYAYAPREDWMFEGNALFIAQKLIENGHLKC
jgi:hypothetical protein